MKYNCVWDRLLRTIKTILFVDIFLREHGLGHNVILCMLGNISQLPSVLLDLILLLDNEINFLKRAGEKGRDIMFITVNIYTLSSISVCTIFY